MTTEFTCPKCQATMRSYERNGIQIEQCTECRGVFLDRGELEQLMDAEAAYSQTPQQGQAPTTPTQPVPGPPPQATPPPGYGWDQGGGHHGKPAYGGHSSKRRKGFLGELFD